jgi:hypothetical protein
MRWPTLSLRQHQGLSDKTVRLAMHGNRRLAESISACAPFGALLYTYRLP